MGILIAEGTIDLSQFWPNGQSDADTTKVIVDRFHYQTHEGARSRTTRIFEGAKSVGRGSKEVIDKQGRITIRYQGIDAPELHYQAQAEIKQGDPDEEEKRAAFHSINKRYRQHYGETAALRLAEHVRELARGAASIPCRVQTYVDHPNEVFDVYGRMIGNLLVGQSFEHDLNLWLVEQGWAFPTFYSSMQAAEIEAFLGAAKRGRKRGIWKNYSEDTSHFDWQLADEKSGTEEDAGPVLLPKIFRRVVAHRTNGRAKLVKGGFKSYLRQRQPAEACFETADFLAKGPTAAVPHFLYEYLEGHRFTARPEGLVYQEAPSTLLSAQDTTISQW